MVNKIISFSFLVMLIVVMSACSECGSCHYVVSPEEEVELGEYCDEKKDKLLNEGYTDSSGTYYEVVCHIH
jgi:hypothetical protein